MNEPLLSISDLTVVFSNEGQATEAVKGVSFAVNRGEVVAIVGESGSGKSVTCLSTLGLLPKAKVHYPMGEIWFRSGELTLDLLKCPPEQLQDLRGNKLSMIFQEPMTSLNPVFTCGEQVVEAITRHRKISRKDAQKETIRLFTEVKLPEPEKIFRKYPHEISGGQKQRVMIAMAISGEPDLLIADEPTTALDVTVQKSILELLKEVQERNRMGMIFITHDLGIVAEIADRVVVMYRGKIVEQGSTSTIFNSPQHPYTKALLACRPILHPKGKRLPIVSDFWVEDGDPQQPIPTATHSQPTDPVIPVDVPESKNNIGQRNPMIRVENLAAWFPKTRNIWGTPTEYTKAVDNVSFDVYEGETLGIVGESGCGKTTLGRCLLRLIPARSGHIWYKGKDLLQMKGSDLLPMRKEVQVVFQDPYSSLNPRLTIGDALTEALSVHGKGRNSRDRKDHAIALLEQVSLKAEHFNRYPHAFSGGQRQRIGIARALALAPDLIVFDESVSALDVSVQAQVLNLINELKQVHGFTALFISHDLGVVKYISDRIMVMNKGKIEEMGEVSEIWDSPKSAYTLKLLEAIPGRNPIR